MKIAVVGASGLVGKKILEVMNEYNIKYDELILYSSKKSAGKSVDYNNKKYKYIELKEENIESDIDLAFFSAGASTSKMYSQYFINNKTYVVDNSSAFRNDNNVPLVIPEINSNSINKSTYLISNPNCSTTQALLPLEVLNKTFGITRVDYTTYQAVSGSGLSGLKDLKNTMQGQKPSCYPKPIHNNVIALIGTITDNDFTDEEIKMVNETKKILSLEDIEVSSLCVRVPVENSHTVSMTVKTKKDINVEKYREELSQASGIVIVDDPKNNVFPIPTEATGYDDVFVGRIRKDLFNDKTIHLICVSDNIRKGAASNTVQIGKYIIKNIINK